MDSVENERVVGKFDEFSGIEFCQKGCGRRVNPERKSDVCP
jgi:hypothetical protein